MVRTARKTSTGLVMASMLTPEISEATFRFTATGGVTMPMQC